MLTCRKAEDKSQKSKSECPLNLHSFATHKILPVSRKHTLPQKEHQHLPSFDHELTFSKHRDNHDPEIRQTAGQHIRQGHHRTKNAKDNNLSSNQLFASLPEHRTPLKSKDAEQKWLTQTLGNPKNLGNELTYLKKTQKSIENTEPIRDKILSKITEKQKLLEQLKKIVKQELPTRMKNHIKDVIKRPSYNDHSLVDEALSKTTIGHKYFRDIKKTHQNSDKSFTCFIKKVNPEDSCSKGPYNTPKTHNKYADTSINKKHEFASSTFHQTSGFHDKSPSLRLIKKDQQPHNNYSRKFTLFDFKIIKKLGEGKFGTVFTAMHKQTSSLYALKKISKSVIKSHLMVDQLTVEIKIQSCCDQKNIVRLYDCFDDNEHLYLVLEYMPDGTLFEYLKKKKVLRELEAAEKVKEVAEAVKYLHDRGIAHRDIKPQNIVMSNATAKLCDFGWAALCNERRRTYCGTFDYAAPEILEGSEYDMSVDLWCLGVLAYELMVGKAPFYHISRKETMKKIMNADTGSLEFPEGLSDKAVSFIGSLLKKQPELRLTIDAVLKHPFLAQVQSE